MSVQNSLEGHQAIIWLGPAAEDSDIAISCLERLRMRRPSITGRKLWSQREGQALLALGERPAWSQIAAPSISHAHNPLLVLGDMTLSMEAVLSFRDLLLEISERGRMEHHFLAHAMLASNASRFVRAFLDLRTTVPTSSDPSYPPAISQLDHASNPTLNEIESQLDMAINIAETRWTMLQNDVQTSLKVEMLSPGELDDEIERYTILLQQMDMMDLDLQHLESLTTTASISCRQANAHTPRASPEIMP